MRTGPFVARISQHALCRGGVCSWGVPAYGPGGVPSSGPLVSAPGGVSQHAMGSAPCGQNDRHV